jgi:hypothetical protein
LNKAKIKKNQQETPTGKKKAIKHRNEKTPLNHNPNVNGLNSPIKRHKLSDWIKKQDPTISGLTRNIPHNQRHTQIKNKSWKKICQACVS